MSITFLSDFGYLDFGVVRRQCRINYGSGGSPEPGPLNSAGLIISQKYIYTYKIYHKLRQFTDQYTHLEIHLF